MIAKRLVELEEHSLAFRRLVRLFRAYTRPFNWKRFINRDAGAWTAALRRAKNGPRVLVATSIGSYWAGNYLESMLAAALTLRGANVEVLLCDNQLPACQFCRFDYYPDTNHFVRHGPKKDFCIGCFSSGKKMFDLPGIAIRRYSEFLKGNDLTMAKSLSTEVDYKQIGSFKWENLAVGEHALAGALRFFAVGDLAKEPHGEQVLRRYFHASLLTAMMAKNLFDTNKYKAAVFHHGIYVPQGLIAEAARSAGVNVVNWNPAYRKKCFIFSHHETYHHSLMSEPTSVWENIKWNDRIDRDLLTYLKSRWDGSGDWIWFHDNPEKDIARIKIELGLDPKKPAIGLLTNVVWDAQLHYPANAFPTMLDWILKSVSYFSKREDVQLIIRIHPAEIRGTIPSRQRVAEEISAAFPQMPPHIKVIPPESNLSTYATMAECDSVIIYGTKTGVELTAMGIPVIVAGEAWIRNKGISIDANSVLEYFRILDTLPLKKRMDEEKILRAKKYAYHFFFRRMVPVNCMKPTKREKNPPYRLDVETIDGIAAGMDVGLDIICNGILQGSDFVYPAETRL
jgi:hypothetical protein